MLTRHLFQYAAISLLLTLTAAPVRAVEYPSKPVRIVTHRPLPTVGRTRSLVSLPIGWPNGGDDRAAHAQPAGCRRADWFARGSGSESRWLQPIYAALVNVYYTLYQRSFRIYHSICGAISYQSRSSRSLQMVIAGHCKVRHQQHEGTRHLRQKTPWQIVDYGAGQGSLRKRGRRVAAAARGDKTDFLIPTPTPRKRCRTRSEERCKSI